MIDAHTHFGIGGSLPGEAFVCSESESDWGRPAPWRFYGVHPWHSEEVTSPSGLHARLCAVLDANPRAGVGEIGLDRLKSRTITPRQREVFELQLTVAAAKGRPVQLHGAKCWGEVVHMAQRFSGAIPAFLFHGFSRSAGLLGEISAVNGFISIGAAVLNSHAVNYHALVKMIPPEAILFETDGKEGAGLCEIVAETAKIRGMDAGELEALADANARRFTEALR